jgi:lipopolysaccharide transport system permease protein
MRSGTVTTLRNVVSRWQRVVDLVLVLGPREVQIRYRTSALDIVWGIVTPVVVLVVYGLVLTESFNVTGSCSPYLSSAWAGLVVWTFFASSVGGAVTSMLTANDLVTKVYFPREALPLSVVAASLPELVVGMAILVVVAVVQGVHLTVAVVGVVLPLSIVIVWSAALSIIAGVVAAFVRDLVHAVHLALRVGFFATPVMYETSFLPGPLAWTAEVSPVAVAITGVRDTMLCGALPPLGLSLLQLAAGCVLLTLASLYTASVESRMSDVL